MEIATTRSHLGPIWQGKTWGSILPRKFPHRWVEQNNIVFVNIGIIHTKAAFPGEPKVTGEILGPGQLVNCTAKYIYDYLNLKLYLCPH